MKLAQIIAELETADDALCIVAKRPWTPHSDAKLTALTEQYGIPTELLADGYAYFLEVHTVLEDVLSDRASLLSDAQRVDAVIFYAENDAYPDWLNAIA